MGHVALKLFLLAVYTGIFKGLVLKNHKYQLLKTDNVAF